MASLQSLLSGGLRQLLAETDDYDRMVEAIQSGNLALAGNLSVGIAVKAHALMIEDRLLPGEQWGDRASRKAAASSLYSVAKFVNDICADAVLRDLENADDE